MNKQEIQAFLGKPDASLGMTHCLFVVADDTTALKLLLHSNLHKGEYYATGGPYFRGCIEISSDLAIDFNPEGKEDPFMMLALLRFKEEVTDDSEVFKTFLKCIAEFNKFPGISASLRPAGPPPMIKEDLLSELQWNDMSFFWTPLLTVAAEFPQPLKDFQSNECYGKWLMTELPYLKQEGMPPAAIFFAPDP
eukprot:UN2251